MDVHDQLNEIVATIRGAKAMPMSASCLVNRTEMLEAIERLRHVLPANLDDADALLSDRDAVLKAGRDEAGRLLFTYLANKYGYDKAAAEAAPAGRQLAQTTPPAAPEKPVRCSASPQRAQEASSGAKPAARASLRRKASAVSRPAARSWAGSSSSAR